VVGKNKGERGAVQSMQLPIVIKRDRWKDFLIALFCIATFAGVLWLVPQMTEEAIMDTRTRKGGIIKLIILGIGHEWFVAGMILGGLALLIFGIGLGWRATSSAPDFKVDRNGFSFHPARFGRSLQWSEISHWKIATDGETKLLKIYVPNWYWKPLGIIPRKSIAIREEPEVLVQIAALMSAAGVRREVEP